MNLKQNIRLKVLKIEYFNSIFQSIHLREYLSLTLQTWMASFISLKKCIDREIFFAVHP